MADPELVEILRQGSDVWNRWREHHQDIQVDLSFADLTFADLRGANLDNANLDHTDLSFSDLSRAHLSHAHLHLANLHHAYLESTCFSHASLDLIILSYAYLKGADLSYAYLKGAFLNHVILNYAYLKGADLSGANLSYADLSHAHLDGANLSKTNLSEAKLSWTGLNNANLSETLLNNTLLEGADLSFANLKEAKARYTLFIQLDLRTVKGLIEIDHQGPSRVELQTIQLPQDGSALHFLRGTGVAEEWIAFYQSTMMYPIQYHSCFISYAHQDDTIARRLHSDLQDHGVRCWFAPHDMRIGDKVRPRIDEAIHLQDKLLLILSEHSVASDWVEHEVETALARERRDKRTILFPIRLDNAILERSHMGWASLVQNERHIGNFTGWKDHDRYQAAFQRLLHDLKKADEPEM